VKFLKFILTFFLVNVANPAFSQNGRGTEFGIFDAWQGLSLEASSGPRRYQLGEEISLKFANLDGWIMRELVAERINAKPHFTPEQVGEVEAHLNDKNKPLGKATRASISNYTRDLLGRMYPIVNGIELHKATRLGFTSGRTVEEDTIHNVRFIIARDSAEGEAWSKLLKTSEQTINPTITVGYKDSPSLPPRQFPTVIDGSGEKVSLVIELYHTWTLILTVVVIFVILAILLWLAPKSEILRDTSQPLRPDGTYPWSLSRAQMAFWFMAVFASFMFLWVVTSRLDTLTESSLALIGIGSGTALGAALVSNMTRDTAAEQASSVADAKYASRRGKPWAVLKQEALQREADLERRLHPAASAPPEILPSETEQAEIREEAKFFRKGWLSEIFFDWLTEGKVVSFHRFQMMAWTLALGFVFLVQVLRNLELPNFDGTLLALTGISAGTYLGFKFPPIKAP
jgi:hypothetical protein